MTMTSIKLTVATAALAVSGATGALGQSFPEKPVELIVPYAPGGGSDISARVFAGCLEGVLPEKVVVRNITGGAGAVAEDTVAKEAPSGYKLLWQHQSLHALSARGVTDHSPESFDVIGQVAFGPWGVFVGSHLPFDDIAGMKQYIADNPGEMKVGAALGGLSHFASLVFMGAADMDIDDTQIIGLAGSKNRVVAILQGNLDGATMDAASAKPYIEAGQMKSIAVLAEQPIEKLPDEATAKDQGVDVTYGVNIITWAPKGTPEEVLTVLRDAWETAATDPECGAAFAEKGFQAMYRDHEAVEAYNTSEMETYRGLVEKYGVD
ncbi:Bug family tripartite tricarboxylate transporter substrate binding protein [Roseovarius sp.]|uniref:Bug family tripartite tricarboxylate transporter substrate binding protein n=1 Tax=Roseovarius sp. TaxID=1486281 RepID=UPI003B58B650